MGTCHPTDTWKRIQEEQAEVILPASFLPPEGLSQPEVPEVQPVTPVLRLRGQSAVRRCLQQNHRVRAARPLIFLTPSLYWTRNQRPREGKGP